jgi:NitT/TauT family transport system ATP-binding protein
MSSVAPASAEPDRPFLRLQGLSKVYATRDGPVRALDQVSVSEGRGEFLSILGPSGCGKSTLLMIAAGLIPPSSGEIAVDGTPVTQPRTDIGIVFQSPVLLEWRTALGNVMLQAEAKKLERRAAEPHDSALHHAQRARGGVSLRPGRRHDATAGANRSRYQYRPAASTHFGHARDA